LLGLLFNGELRFQRRRFGYLAGKTRVQREFTGSCPGAANATQSGTVSAFGEDWAAPNTDATIRPGRCDDDVEEGETPCDAKFKSTCGCYLAWFIPTADIPPCGPYIANVIAQCLPRGRRNLPNGYCPHIKDAKALWYIQVNVERALGLVRTPMICRTELPSGRMFCTVQDCGDCTFKEMEIIPPVTPTDPCCHTCPPCYHCPDHDTRRCAAGEECCGVAGCQYCECPTGEPCQPPDCDQCSHCIEIPADSGDDPATPDEGCAVPCPGLRPIRYHFWIDSDACEIADSTGDSVKGCNITGCPKDTDNTGGFYLRVGCNENDFVELFCGMGAMRAGKQKMGITQKKKAGGCGCGSKPGFFRKVVNYTKSTVKHVLTGMPKTAPDASRVRLELCNACPEMNKADRTCNQCGCPVDAKVARAGEKCPIGKW
jgi:hypothetical protein